MTVKFIVTIIWTSQKWEEWPFDTRPEADAYLQAIRKNYRNIERAYITTVKEK